MRAKISGLMSASIVALLCASTTASAADVIAFQEDFETDGLDARYSVENASDNGNDFFARRGDLSSGTRTTGGTLSGGFFWGGRDLDGSGTGATGGMESDEARITFNSFSIEGLGNFRLVLEAAQGQDEFEADNTFLIQIKIDDGDWEYIGGFRGTGTNSPGRYFVGDENTIATLDQPRLTNNFQTFSWDIPRIGSTMQIRIKQNLNGGDEEYAFDNLRVIGDDALKVVRMSLPASSFDEGTSTTLTLTMRQPAPAGGATISLVSSNTEEVTVPASVVIAEGQTTATAPVTIVADNGFDGDQLVAIVVDGEGYAPNTITLTSVNVDAKPAIVLNEFVTSVPGSLEEDLIGDTNGDGIRNGSQDEFVELVNNDTKDIDLSGWILSDDKGPRHIFPEGTILKPGRAIVVFAGGNPTGLFGGAQVQTATAGNFGYGDTGDVIVLSSGGAEVLSYDYTSTFPSVYQGVTRSPDLTGDYVLYKSVQKGDELFSPGTKVDGSPFGTFSNTLHLSVNKATMAEDDTTAAVATVTLDHPAPAGGMVVEITRDTAKGDEVIVPASITIPEGQSTATFQIAAVNDRQLDGDQVVTFFVRNDDAVPALAYLTISDVETNRYNVVINEAMASLVGIGLDTNGNGTSEEAINDQFIEIVNASGMVVDMSGWSLYSFGESDTNGEVRVHVFPEGTLLADNGAIVIFGGGDEAAINAAAGTLVGGAIAQVSNSGGVGVNLTTSDDGVIRLVNQYGFIINEVIYASAQANQGMSITRKPAVTGEFNTLHVPASLPKLLAASPGADLDGTPFEGNGAVAASDYASVFPDYYEAATGYNYATVFGWSYVSDWPFLYTYDFNNWVWVSEEASGYDSVYYYDYGAGSWYYTDSAAYPWVCNLMIPEWQLAW